MIVERVDKVVTGDFVASALNIGLNGVDVIVQYSSGTVNIVFPSGVEESLNADQINIIKGLFLKEKVSQLDNLQKDNKAKIDSLDAKRKTLAAIGTRVVSIDISLSNIGALLSSLSTFETATDNDVLVNANIKAEIRNHKEILLQMQSAISSLRNAVNTIAVSYANGT